MQVPQRQLSHCPYYGIPSFLARSIVLDAGVHLRNEEGKGFAPSIQSLLIDLLT
jgi:hypothetical protein